MTKLAEYWKPYAGELTGGIGITSSNKAEQSAGDAKCTKVTIMMITLTSFIIKHMYHTVKIWNGVPL